MWDCAWVFLFSPFKSFGFNHYPHILSSSRILLNRIPTFSAVWIFSAHLVLVFMVCSPRSSMPWIPARNQNHRSPKTISCTALESVIHLWALPMVSNINSAYMLLIFNNVLWEIYCGWIPTLPNSNSPNRFSHCSTDNL